LHVSVRTLHGIRALMTLAKGQGIPQSAQELANQKYIDRDYLTQIMSSLKKEGIIGSKKGPSGGYFLKRDPETVTLGEIFRCLEGPTVISPCTKPEHSDCDIIDECGAQDTLSVVADKIDALLDQITLHDLQGDPEAIKSIAGPAQ
jgi:Rrf2 family protein